MRDKGRLATRVDGVCSRAHLGCVYNTLVVQMLCHWNWGHSQRAATLSFCPSRIYYLVGDRHKVMGNYSRVMFRIMGEEAQCSGYTLERQCVQAVGSQKHFHKKEIASWVLRHSWLRRRGTRRRQKSAQRARGVYLGWEQPFLGTDPGSVKFLQTHDLWNRKRRKKKKAGGAEWWIRTTKKNKLSPWVSKHDIYFSAHIHTHTNTPSLMRGINILWLTFIPSLSRVI